MQKEKKKLSLGKRLLRLVIVIVIVLGGLNLFVFGALQIIKPIMGGEIPYVLENALTTISLPAENSNVKEFKKMMGGTATGVCHPMNDEYNINLLKEANIGWVRFDIPSESPYLIDNHGKAILDSNNNYQLKESYINYKNRCKLFKDKGVKVMGITPYIDDMLNEVGLLSVFQVGGEFNNDFENFVKEVSRFYAKDLQGYVDCFQISNELTIDKWMGACTMDQICYYQGELQMKEMYPITHEAGIPIGFNLCGYTLYYYPKQMCDNYSDYFDYVGLDLYLGCFEADYHTTAVYDLLLRHLYALSRKPVMLNEFGYISAGNPLADNEKENYLLNTYGEKFSTEQKIKDNIEEFLTKFDEVSDEPNGSPMTNESRRLIMAGETKQQGLIDAANYIFNKEQISHIYKSLPEGYKLTNYEHNQEGQGKFYKDTIERLRITCPFVCGYFVYMWDDSFECYQCGQENCPVETGWGLVSKVNGATIYNDETIIKKPAYYAIREVFGKIQKDNRRYN